MSADPQQISDITTTAAWQALQRHHDEIGEEHRRDAMFSGIHINTSEDRAVLHTALRQPRGAQLTVDGQNVVSDVHEVLDKMGDFTDRLRSGEWTGATGERIT